MWVLALFLAVPLIEISLFVTVGGWLTLWPTLAIVVGTAVAGSVLLRWQGMKVLAELRADLAAMRDPFSPLAHRTLILLAGMMLILPGFFTDALGLLLLIPAVRRLVIGRIWKRIGRGVLAGRAAGAANAARDWEDAEFEMIAPDRDHAGANDGRTRH